MNNNRFTALADCDDEDMISTIINHTKNLPTYKTVTKNISATHKTVTTNNLAVNKTLTENNSATYKTSKNPNLDLFFHVTPDTSPQTLISILEESWAHNPLTTLKLICNLRGIRGTGKSDKQSFYTSAIWLHNNHAKTLVCNIPVFVEFGYFKDLLEILYRLIQGDDVRKVSNKLWMAKKLAKGKGMARKMYFLNKKREKREEMKRKNMAKRGRGNYRRNIREYEGRGRGNYSRNIREYEGRGRGNYRRNIREDEGRGRGNYRRNIREDEGKSSRTSKSRAERVEENRIQMEKNKYEAKKLRKEKEFAMKQKLNDRYGSDQGFKMLHDQVSYFFAECLRSDIELLNNGESMKISLAAKWCPSVDSSYDKALLICESVAKLLYPWDSDSEFETLDEFSYIVRIKNKLRKEVLVPLRNALMLPEVYMSAKQWSSITYERVASIAMKNYTNIFLHRDNERFRSYLEKVKHGDTKIAAGALLPHEIISSLQHGSGDSMVAELQWKQMVDDLLKEGKLTNCIAVCDVSGSMCGTPMEVCVALGLLVSELSQEPWKGHVITFSHWPQLHLIEGHDLRSKTEFIERMDWGMNTNLQRVFDQMLEVAVKNKLSEDDMVKRVFIFSDMEFDQASESPWETDYEAIQRKFRSCGYEKVPEIVFWNLRDSRSTPVTANQKGVALLSGFSKNLLTLFLEGGGMINPSDGADGGFNPVSIMDAAISGELYQKLVVCD